MSARRIENGVQRGASIFLEVDGRRLHGYSGETLATVMLAADVVSFGRRRSGEPRMPVCNMGACYECVVVLSGVGQVRSCMIMAESGMKVSTGEP